MNKTEILNIVNEPSKHIQIVKIDGKDSIVYSSQFVELLELIPTMLTKADMVTMLEKLKAEIEEKHREEEFMNDWSSGYNSCLVDGYNSIQQKIDALKGNENE